MINVSKKKYVLKEVFKTKNEELRKEIILKSIVNFLQHEMIKDGMR